MIQFVCKRFESSFIWPIQRTLSETLVKKCFLLVVTRGYSGGDGGGAAAPTAMVMFMTMSLRSL